MLKEIESERSKLLEDRARMEIAKTLQSKNADDSVLSRVEVDAAVKYAEVKKHSSEKNFSVIGGLSFNLSNNEFGTKFFSWRKFSVCSFKAEAMKDIGVEKNS